MATIVQRKTEIQIPEGSIFFGKMYFVKWRDAKNRDTGEVTANIDFLSENHREMFTVKLPIGKVNERQLDALPLLSEIEIKNATGNFWNSTSGDFSNTNLSIKADEIIVKKQAAPTPQGN